jgi:hypothetical protein
MDKTILTQDFLKSIVHYDPETGIFTWLKRPINMFLHCKFPKMSCNIWNAQNAGNKINRIKNEYVIIKILEIDYLAHVLAWLYMTGKWPDNDIDHKDTIKSNNQFINLRTATKSQNSGNTKKPVTNKSGYKGVCWHKKSGKWRAQIIYQGKSYWLGVYETPEEAHEAYCKAATHYFGEFARFK